LALGGRHNYEIHNNQINDGVGCGGMHQGGDADGRNAWGWLSLVGTAIELNDEKMERRADHWP